jgi:hypothetical protein
LDIDYFLAGRNDWRGDVGKADGIEVSFFCVVCLASSEDIEDRC